ncbi:ATP-dependent DNA helicase [Chitinimonas lacunae]|uniref:ATP-dependent DNA helicase n=1 Tax=Chitinimonas lacunae TaxID=1963018 RepID=A0ABV8MN58_9NEIS
MSYRVAVRELCEFAAKTGDLDLRFTPAPTAEEGIAGHATVTGRRGAGYRSEVSLEGDHGPLIVRGRCDGFDPTQQRVEEIKTYRGELDAMPDNHRALHWAQARVYGCLLCREYGLDSIDVTLVYFQVDRQEETVLAERYTAQALEAFFADLCERFLHWAEQEMAHRAACEAELLGLSFPFPDFHPGQRQLAETVYKAARLGRQLLAEAPTGIGKTLGTLFPLLKAMPAERFDRLFFLTAKTSGRQLALDALTQLRPDLPSLRVLELVARDKACVHPDLACHGESCPLARGFYDRLPAARAEAVAQARLDQTSVRKLAEAHQVCPYYLSQELARWADLTIGDYNYFFDSSALLHSLTVTNGWRIALLIDEAHNLVERGRSMYSTTLDQAGLSALRRQAPAALKKPLDALQRTWRELNAAQEQDYQVYPEPLSRLLGALHKADRALADHLDAQPIGPDSELMRWHFDIQAFLRLAEQFGEHSLFDLSLRSGPDGRPLGTFCLRNLVPAPFLAPRFAQSASTVLFSATLTPSDYYLRMLGLAEDTACLSVDGPFRPEQLSVRVVRAISTRYSDRAASLQPIAELIVGQYQARPGNYLAFFSSFAYLEQVLAVVTALAPELPCWAQSRQMDEAARHDFLARFIPDGSGIGFAVLGGAFAEGVDLPGSRLIGAFVATLGLPQFNPINEQFRQRLQQLFGQGYDYAYLYPGLQKVVQAAGRVIRTPQDRGVVYLIDDRYDDSRVRKLLPRWWRVERNSTDAW